MDIRVSFPVSFKSCAPILTTHYYFMKRKSLPRRLFVMCMGCKMVFLTLLNTLSCRCTLTPSKYLLDCSQFPIQYCFVRSSGSSAYRYGRSFLFHLYRGGGCRVLFRPPLPKVDLTHTASKMTTRDAKRSISTILRKNRGL